MRAVFRVFFGFFTMGIFGIVWDIAGASWMIKIFGVLLTRNSQEGFGKV
jgi:hypothetical protein